MMLKMSKILRTGLLQLKLVTAHPHNHRHCSSHIRETLSHNPFEQYNSLSINELVTLLEQESARDIFVCRVPKELKYVDYMVVCSGHNFRSMSALAEIVRKSFKEKNEDRTIGLPMIEGAKSRDWMALDLGNIALHIMSSKAREYYDLEYLWAVGGDPVPPPET